MGKLIHRVLSALVALAYVVVAARSNPVAETLGVAAAMLVVVLFIWYSDELGENLTHWGIFPLSGPSPGWALRLFGWLILLTPLFFALVGAKP